MFRPSKPPTGLRDGAPRKWRAYRRTCAVPWGHGARRRPWRQQLALRREHPIRPGRPQVPSGGLGENTGLRRRLGEAVSPQDVAAGDPHSRRGGTSLDPYTHTTMASPSNAEPTSWSGAASPSSLQRRALPRRRVPRRSHGLHRGGRELTGRRSSLPRPRAEIEPPIDGAVSQAVAIRG
jgi:hypothetical protein